MICMKNFLPHSHCILKVMCFNMTQLQIVYSDHVLAMPPFLI